MEEGWRVHTAPDGRRYYHHQPTKTTQWAAPPGWQDAAATPAGDPFARGPHGLLPALYADGVEIRRQAAEVPVQVRSSATHDKEDDEDFRTQTSTPLQPYQYSEEGFGEEEDGGGGVFEEEEDAGGGVAMLDAEPQELSPEQYGQNSPMKGARKRASKGYQGVVWDFTKRLLDPALMDMHANNKGSWIARFTHVCTRCWRKLTLGYDNETGWWKTTRAVAHSKKYHANDCKVGREAAAREDERAIKTRRLMSAAGEFQIPICQIVRTTQ